LELKNARRVLIEDNLMENAWPDAQVGWGVIFNAFRDPDWTAIEDVRFIHNQIRNVTSGINLRGMDDGDTRPRMRRVTVADNRLENVGAYGSGGRAFQLLLASEDVTIDHNSVSGSVSSAFLLDGLPAGHVRAAFTNNVVPHGEYGVFGNGGTLGTDAMAKFASQWTLAKNAFVGTPESLASKYPKNFLPRTADRLSALIGTDSVPVGVRASQSTAQPPR
jgi:hypothetical protein